MIFDTHCHLGYDGVDARAVRARALEAGVTRVLDVGIDLASSEKAHAAAAELAGTHWSAGLHPNHAGAFAAEWPALARLAHEPTCRAIGETGLDFYRDHATQEQQEHSLHAHLELARRRSLPVILHCRDAFERLFALLAQEAPVRGVMHCFSGGVAEARQALDLGLHLSFAGPLTYPKSDALRAAAAHAPAERVLVETDAPFLPPQGRRGQRNEPAWVRVTLETLAGVRGVPFEAMAEVTTANACELFAVA
jgi:TatD DNase family protein